MPHVWLARGCPTLPPDARRVGARCVRSAQSVAGVRCCGGSTCVSVCLSQQSCDGDDGQAATLVQARAYCERRGRRLCTRAELGRGFCCKSGCAMDGMLVWTEDACTAPDNSGLPAAAQWPPPRGTGHWLSRAARCLGLSVSNLSLHYPADADAHFLEMRRQLRPWTQGARPHRYAGYNGPWLEGRWIRVTVRARARARVRVREGLAYPNPALTLPLTPGGSRTSSRSTRPPRCAVAGYAMSSARGCPS